MHPIILIHCHSHKANSPPMKEYTGLMADDTVNFCHINRMSISYKMMAKGAHDKW